jgi:hypothetical protein
MPETVNHQNLVMHSANFQLGGGIYSISVTSGNIAVRSDAIEFQRLVNGAFVSIDPPARFVSTDVGSTRLSKLLPAGTYRWTISLAFGHNINTAVVKAN